VNTPPDFTAMLDAITEQAGTPVTEPAASTAAATTPSIQAGGSPEASGVASTIVTARAAAGIAAAAAAACAGMADRRLIRGDIEGATLWSELAAEHD